MAKKSRKKKQQQRVPASPKTSSSRSSLGCAVQIAVPLQVRLEVVIRFLLRPRPPQEGPCPASSAAPATTTTRIAAAVSSTYRGKVGLWSAPLCLSCGAWAMQTSSSCSAAAAFSSAIARNQLHLNTEYIVCNPATEKWTVLPDTEELHQRMNRIHLAFDPSVPSCFYVFLFVLHDFHGIIRAEIYSSETGGWISRESEWGDFTEVNDNAEHTFFNGTLYAITPKLSLIKVDTEGKIWRKIRMPRSYIRPTPIKDEAFIAYSQGRLYAMHIVLRNDNQLSVWVFETDGNEQWTLKHTTSITKLLRRQQYSQREFYQLIAAHPEQNLIFLTGGAHNELLSYDMDNQEEHVICTLQKYFQAPMLPYIPCFAEWPSDGC